MLRCEADYPVALTEETGITDINFATNVAGARYDNITIYPAIYKGSYTASTLPAYTPYVPPCQAAVNLPLRGIPDGSGGWAARDYIEVKDGAVKHIKRIDESLLDETVKLEEQTGVIMATPAITDITSTELGQALSGMKSVQYYTRIYHTSALPVEMEATITKLGRG